MIDNMQVQFKCLMIMLKSLIIFSAVLLQFLAKQVKGSTDFKHWRPPFPLPYLGIYLFFFINSIFFLLIDVICFFFNQGSVV